MASDLISRAAAIAEIEEYIEEYPELDENGYHNLKWCAMEEAKEVLSMLSAVDAVPVVHARWIEEEGYDGDSYYDCSVCGKKLDAYRRNTEGKWHGLLPRLRREDGRRRGRWMTTAFPTATRRATQTRQRIKH